VSSEALCHRPSLSQVVTGHPGGITVFDEAHLWADAADWRPTLSVAATRLQGRRRLALMGSLPGPIIIIVFSFWYGIYE